MGDDDSGPTGGRWVRRVRSAARRSLARGLGHVPVGGRAEALLMRLNWRHGSAEVLDTYLVSGYQNPHVNVQSILLRHDLAAWITGAADALMQDEIRFAVELHEVLRERAAELGVTMGTYCDPDRHAAVRRVDAAIADREATFAERWRALLAHAEAPPRRVLEFACGSANDYRAIAEYGIGRHLDYVGVDISPKNVANARKRFPTVDFRVGDVLDLADADGAFDLVVASDLFEHLAPTALDRALDEAIRLARDGVVLTFFNMSDDPEHVFRRRKIYHWNTLSRRRIEDRLRQGGMRAIRSLPIRPWLASTYGYPDYYNPTAWTIIAERQPTIIPLLPHRWEDRTPET